MTAYVFDTSIGKLAVCEEKGAIVRLDFGADDLPKECKIGETPLLLEAARQIRSYLAGELKTFSLPLAPEGTRFSQRVWINISTIPYGKTATYKDVAYRVGHPEAFRAVGHANGQNPIPIIIPCHRVIGSNGSLHGYRWGLDMKQKLLDLEKRHSS